MRPTASNGATLGGTQSLDGDAEGAPDLGVVAAPHSHDDTANEHQPASERKLRQY
jgi:hypothetical protein